MSLDVIVLCVCVCVCVYTPKCVSLCVAFGMHVLVSVCEQHEYMNRLKHLTFTLEAPYTVSTKKGKGVALCSKPSSLRLR